MTTPPPPHPEPDRPWGSSPQPPDPVGPAEDAPDPAAVPHPTGSTGMPAGTPLPTADTPVQGSAAGRIAVAISPFVALVLFFLVGSAGGWRFSWLFFLLIPVVAVVVRELDKARAQR